MSTVRAAVTTWILDSWPGAPVGYRALGMENKLQFPTGLSLLVLNKSNRIHVGSKLLSLSNTFQAPYLMSAFVLGRVFEAKHCVRGNLFSLNGEPMFPPTGTSLHFDTAVSRRVGNTV